LYVGTDDGLIQVTQDGGATWTKIDNIPGVPDTTYVNEIVTSQHDRNTVYVTFNHHRYGDFHPYIFLSKDAGKTWTAIQSNLPERGTVYCLAEDHVNANLLFAGTEFGVYFSIDGGQKWIQLKAGLPTIAVRDMEIQQRENDLVIASFGRGFYILDDYTPLRSLSKETLDKAATVFPIKDAWMYVPSYPLGTKGKGALGESYFSAPNPKPGAVFTFYLKDAIKTIKDKRKEAEAEKIKNNQPLYYPSLDSLRMEDEQTPPQLMVTITDDAGNVVRRIKTSASKGMHRITWDFRYAPFSPVALSTADEDNPFSYNETGYMALPGNYKMFISKYEDGAYTQMTEPQPFTCQALNATSLPAADKKALDNFSKKAGELRRIISATDEYKNELYNKLSYINAAILQTPLASPDLAKTAELLKQRLNKAVTLLDGDGSLASREFETKPSVSGRIANI
ncbi:MAG: glycosyl hydrolase, partial [Chitinophagia bacterium]|nr:glycosyl hydrolase [Chitinophagia bacterium]